LALAGSVSQSLCAVLASREPPPCIHMLHAAVQERGWRLGSVGYP